MKTIRLVIKVSMIKKSPP